MLLLLMWTLLLQSKQASDSFEAFEKNIEGAKTISAKFEAELSIKAGAEPQIMKSSGTILLQGDDKANATIRYTEGGQEHQIKLVSDGVTLSSAFDSDEQSQNVPKYLRTGFSVAFTRIGILPLLTQASGDAEKKEQPNPKDQYELSDFKQEEERADSNCLSYKVKERATGKMYGAKIWYHPKTFELKKRFWSLKSGQREVTYSETFESFKVNIEIPAAQFTVPGKK